MQHKLHRTDVSSLHSTEVTTCTLYTTLGPNDTSRNTQLWVQRTSSRPCYTGQKIRELEKLNNCISHKLWHHHPADMFNPVHVSSRRLTRGSDIAEWPCISSTLHWRLSKWIICYLCNDFFFSQNLTIYTVSQKKTWPLLFLLQLYLVNLYNNAVLLSNAKFKQNMTKKVTKSWQNRDNQ